MATTLLLVISIILPIFYFLQIHATSSDGGYELVKDEWPGGVTYDYIIVGGGTAGCPLAATLSAEFKVLVLERGDSPFGNVNITRIENFRRTLADTSETSPSQRFVSEDGVFNNRARVLGGGSAINAGFYSRADVSFITGAGWDAQLVNRSYEWVERVVAFRPTVTPWQSAVRAALVASGVKPFNGFTYDHVSGTKIGGTIFDARGDRHTAAELLTTYAQASNIDVVTHAIVQRIIFGGGGGGRRPAARGVVFTDSMGRHRHVYLSGRAGSDVVVCAGAIGSPQLLMLSGVGPREHLASLGIDSVADLESVGEGVADNPMNGIYVPSPRQVGVSLIQVVGITHFGSFVEAASGSGAMSSKSSSGYFGMLSPSIGQLSTVPPHERTMEALARAANVERSLPSKAFKGGFILEKIAGPLSKGWVKLNSTKVTDNPVVKFNYFEHPLDMERCMLGMQTIEKVVESHEFSSFKYNNSTLEYLKNITSLMPVNLLPHHPADVSSLRQFCKDTVMTIWHYHGGCNVGRVVEKGSYRVIGVDSLRVIDGSTFDSSPGTNPQATVMMLGRYMGVQILRERGFKVDR